MKAYIKSACLVALTISLVACSDDDKATKTGQTVPQSEEGTVPAIESKPEMSILSGTSLGIGADLYSVNVSLPNGEGELPSVYSVVFSRKDNSVKNMFESNTGNKSNLSVARSLGKNLEAVIVTRYSSEDMIDGTSYLFVKNEEGAMELATEVKLDAELSEEDLVGRILDFQAEVQGRSVVEAINTIVEVENASVEATEEVAAEETTTEDVATTEESSDESSSEVVQEVI